MTERGSVHGERATACPFVAFDDDGELVFNDSQARRMERAMANMEFSFGQRVMYTFSSHGAGRQCPVGLAK